MGGAASKPVRQFPKSVKSSPSWAGARTPNPGEVPSSRPNIPRASETKNEAIERDSRDPQFMANLSKLGAVKVDHRMQTVRPVADGVQNAYRTRLQSEAEATSAKPTRNRLVAASITELLQERKSLTTQEELEKLAERYGIDVEALENLARFVNSPSVDKDSVRRTVNEDGIESLTMKATWVDPDMQEQQLQIRS
ncbi:uncharacterized protein FIBRA_01249 [Fibroporia radiculosa]|uniref:Uncharacterized protein n=1 Tax=Fibroporia radiculosa TaxID=599839 RepID=J4H100_9APHY|nr:uncharacterized protein FIBRA_01249 [Fibroporia radiculosa]CCL99234.1 predicted protein [Fibroporia radiculosa]